AVLAVGTVASGIGIWSAMPGKDQAHPPALPRGYSSPPVAEPLDRESVLRTTSGIDLVVRHPGTWRLTSTAADGYIALQDPRTTGVFLTAMEPSSDPALQFARQWAVSISRKYGRVELSDDGQYDSAGAFWRFKLDVRRSTVSEPGVLVVEIPPAANGPTVYRWWALLGQSAANTPTALAMANSLSARQPDR
ncbi:MAG: hypothetical protein ACREPM_12025, partial [Gemmatimonadaceae bacterium]